MQLFLTTKTVDGFVEMVSHHAAKKYAIEHLKDISETEKQLGGSLLEVFEGGPSIRTEVWEYKDEDVKSVRVLQVLKVWI